MMVIRPLEIGGKFTQAIQIITHEAFYSEQGKRIVYGL